MPIVVNKKQNSVVIEGVRTIRHIAKNDKWEVDAGFKKHRKRLKKARRFFFSSKEYPTQLEFLIYTQLPTTHFLKQQSKKIESLSSRWTTPSLGSKRSVVIAIVIFDLNSILSL